jgi:O-acetylserine/cysteine efflux transporter
MKLQHLGLVLLINLAFGLHPAAAKYGVYEIPPILFALLRATFAAIVLAPWLRLSGGNLKYLFLIGLTLGAINYGFTFSAYGLTDNVATIAVVSYANVPIAALLGMIFFRERPGLRGTAGMLMAFLGVAMITFDPRAFDFIGAVLLTASGAAGAAIGMTLVRYLRSVPVFTVQGWIALLSIPLLLPVSLALESNQVGAVLNASWLAWASVAFTVIGTSLIGHGALNYLLQRYPVSTVLPAQLAAPVVSILVGVFLFGNRLSLLFVLGCVLTLFGVLLVILPRKAPS